jgi:hypothetical protein
MVSLNPQRAHGYAYSSNNPTSRSDPDGRKDSPLWLHDPFAKQLVRQWLLDELGLVGQIAEILSVLPYSHTGENPGKVTEEGIFVNHATQCTSFSRMLLSIFVEGSLKPRKLGAKITPGAVFGVKTGKSKLAAPTLKKVKKRKLKSLDKDKLWALQSFNTVSGKQAHASLLVYSELLGEWITIESNLKKKKWILSETSGANIFRLDDVIGKGYVFNAYEIGPKYKPRDPSLEDWEFLPDE